MKGESSVGVRSKEGQDCFRGWPKKRRRANTTCASGEQKPPCAEVDGEVALGESGTIVTSPWELGPFRQGRGLCLAAHRMWPVLRRPCRLWPAKCPDTAVAARGLEPMAGFAFMTQSAGVPHVATSHLCAAFAK